MEKVPITPLAGVATSSDAIEGKLVIYGNDLGVNYPLTNRALNPTAWRC
jgi:hypothetical protein